MQSITSKLFEKGFFLTDGGLETTLVFHEGIELNHFAAFELILSDHGRKVLKKYYTNYLNIASRYKLDFILETPTWRASTDWGKRLGYSLTDIHRVNLACVGLMRELADEYQKCGIDVFISGNIGPRGDGYLPGEMMTSEEARNYHSSQTQSFALSDVDLISAMTINYPEEALGITLAAKDVNIPVVISFTVETNGKLPSGDMLKSAIELLENKTAGYPEHYMINCAHPEHFKDILREEGAWKEKIKAVRANASTKSHAELDESMELDTGDQEHLALNYKELHEYLPNLSIYGGCCGTDHGHIEQICQVLFQPEIANSNG